MKKLLVFMLALSIVFPVIASDLKSNAYQISHSLAARETQAVTFTLPSRDLFIHNYDILTPVWVAIDTPSATSCTFDSEGCIRIASAATVEFRNYTSSGVTLINDSDNIASWINVIATY